MADPTRQVKSNRIPAKFQRPRSDTQCESVFHFALIRNPSVAGALLVSRKPRSKQSRDSGAFEDEAPRPPHRPLTILKNWTALIGLQRMKKGASKKLAPRGESF